MGKQIEKPGVTVEQLEATLGMHPGSGTLVSGGMIENFREGWALRIMPHSKTAHYFVRDTSSIDSAKALCGFVAPVRWLYGQGNFPCCQLCLKRELRHLWGATSLWPLARRLAKASANDAPNE